MKKTFLSLTVIALAALALTGCDDVPEPYNQPSITPDKPSAKTDPAGTGTAADPYNVARVQELYDNSSYDANADVYVKGIVSSINELDISSFGNATYYISDDGTTANQYEIYRGYYFDGAKFTSTDQLQVGDTVVVRGKLTLYNTTREMAQGSSIVSVNGKTGGSDTPTADATGDGTEASPYNVAAVLKLYADNSYDPDKEVYVTGTVHKIGSIDTGSFGNATYYISDDGTSANDYEIYRGYYFDGAKFTSEDQLKVGDVVVVRGKLTLYRSTKEMAQGSRIISINGKGSGSDNPQPTASTGFNETFAEGQGKFTVNNISLADGLTYIWQWNTSKYMKASAYANRHNLAGQSRLTSPAFSLEGLSSATLTFEHAERFFKNAAAELKVQVSTDGENWTDLPVSNYSDGSNWTFNTTTIDLSAYAGRKTVYVGFLYTSTEDAAATWEVRNVVVK